MAIDKIEIRIGQNKPRTFSIAAFPSYDNDQYVAVGVGTLRGWGRMTTEIDERLMADRFFLAWRLK